MPPPEHAAGPLLLPREPPPPLSRATPPPGPPPPRPRASPPPPPHASCSGAVVLDPSVLMAPEVPTMTTNTKRAYKLQEFVAHSSRVNCLKIGRKTSRVLVTGGEDHKVKLWAIGKHIPILTLSHTSAVESVSFDSTEAFVAAGAASGTVLLWDLEKTKFVRTLTGHRSNCMSVDFHPFGKFFASGSLDTNLKIWDIRRKACIHTYKGHTRGVNAVRFTPDGRWVVFGGEDNTLKVWDLTAGKLLHDFKSHEGHIKCIDFHPHQFLLATGSADKTVKFWDLETFELIGSAGPETTGVESMTFNLDGRSLLCGLHESLKVFSWEPIKCHDTVDVGWSRLADLNVHEGKLLGCSFNQSCVGIWVIDLECLEPYATGSAMPLQNDSGSRANIGRSSVLQNENSEKASSGVTQNSDSALKETESTAFGQQQSTRTFGTRSSSPSGSSTFGASPIPAFGATSSTFGSVMACTGGEALPAPMATSSFDETSSPASPPPSLQDKPQENIFTNVGWNDFQRMVKDKIHIRGKQAVVKQHANDTVDLTDLGINDLRRLCKVNGLKQNKNNKQELCSKLKEYKEKLRKAHEAPNLPKYDKVSNEPTNSQDTQEHNIYEQEELAMELAEKDKIIESMKAELEQCKIVLKEEKETHLAVIKMKDEEIDLKENELKPLRKVRDENRVLFNQVQDLKGNIRVFCRVKPLKSSEISVVKGIEDGEICIENVEKTGKNEPKSFKFNKIFGPAASQSEVFADIGLLIRSVMDGYNVSILAYGPSGSGKTYTMSGPDITKEETVGLNIRAMNDLFEICEARANSVNYEVQVQMVEIYNEQVRDLLRTDCAHTSLDIHNLSTINIPDAKLVLVKCTKDVLDLIKVGHGNRAVGATAINERSSRSHSLLIVHVEGKEITSGSTQRGCLYLVDLAASERAGKSGAQGGRLIEAEYINTSLLALGDVMAALAKKSFVSYRNSKLTYVLSHALGGPGENSDTCACGP